MKSDKIYDFKRDLVFRDLMKKYLREGLGVDAILPASEEARLDRFLKEQYTEAIEEEKKKGRIGCDTELLLWDAKAIIPEDDFHEKSEKTVPKKKKTPTTSNSKPACPNCKSTNTELYELRADNGIMGPGYSSWVIESYRICNNCGSHFTPKKST